MSTQHILHPSNTFFISDTHFWHKNVIKYCDRDCKDVEEMNQLLIDGWNSMVGPDDLVYHLGDFGFCSANKAHDILSQLKGRKRLIVGNHDRGFLKKEKFTQHWEWIRDYYSFRHEGTRINLFHFPIAAWDEQGKGAIHLHGHSHGSYPPKGKMMDVGVDGAIPMWEPKTFASILHHMRGNEVYVADGHHNHES